MIKISERKLVRNHQSFTVSLPLIWAISNRLTFGGVLEVFLVENNPEEIIFRVKR